MVHYRDATLEDADAIAALHAKSWREGYRGSFTDAFLDGDLVGERRAVWGERLMEPAPEQYVAVALEDDTLLGFVCVVAHHDPQWGSFVDNLHVAAAAKGRGIGRALMRGAGRWLARRAPQDEIYLWVLEANANARRFYERIGARNAETREMETHGRAWVRSCRYAWPDAAALAGD